MSPRAKILLVDDHIVVREGVRRLLSGMQGASIFEAATGQEALALFRKEKPELVLLDLNLSGIGGLELLRRLLGRVPELQAEDALDEPEPEPEDDETA